MKIAIATPILFDKSSPFNHLFKDIIGGFLNAGHEIVRLVAVRDENEDKYRLGVDNIEYRKYIRKASSHNNIVTRYLLDSWTNIREAHGLKSTNADILFEDVTYSSFWTVRAAKKKNMHVVAMLQDVWPDNAVQSGLIRQDGLLYKYFESWQRYVYRKADRIICISDDMKAYIVSKGVDEKKIDVIYNWGYSDDVVNISWDENEFVRKYQLKRNMFYVVYAGNIGRMQNVELLVRAADILKEKADIQFLIVGDGARKNVIEDMVKGSANIIMLPMQSSELAVHIYSMAGVNIIPLISGATNTALPSKTGVVLSCGRPVIFGFGASSQFSKKIDEYGAGYCVSAEDENELVSAILKVKEEVVFSRERSDCMFRDNFNKTQGVNKYVDVISKAGGKSQ